MQILQTTHYLYLPLHFILPYHFYHYETANLLHLALTYTTIYNHKEKEVNKRITKFLIQGGNKGQDMLLSNESRKGKISEGRAEVGS